MYACTINLKFPPLGSGAGRSGKMKPAFGESLQQGPDLKRNPSTNDVQRPYYPRSLKKLIIWISSLSGVLAKINDKQKGDTDSRAGPTCSRCHHPPQSKWAPGPVSEARVPSEEGRGGFCLKFPRAAPRGLVCLAESRAEEILLSRETESPRQRSRHPISPPAPPKQSALLPLPQRSVEGRCTGKGVADSISSMMGVPVSQAGLWEGPPHTPTDHGAACD